MDWNSIADWFMAIVEHYGLIAILISIIIESAGIPLPTELSFVAGQAMVLTGKASYLEMFAVVVLGQVLGSIGSYFIGIYFAGRIKSISDQRSKIKHSQEIFVGWMKKYGDAAVFVSRVFGYVRPWASYFAGIGEIKFWPFLIFNFLGSVVITILSMLTLGVIVNIWGRFDFLRPYIAVVSIFTFFGFWIYLVVAAHKKKK